MAGHQELPATSWFIGQSPPNSPQTPRAKGYASSLFTVVPDHREQPKSLPSGSSFSLASPPPARRCQSPLSLFCRVPSPSPRSPSPSVATPTATSRRTGGATAVVGRDHQAPHAGLSSTTKRRTPATRGAHPEADSQPQPESPAIASGAVTTGESGRKTLTVTVDKVQTHGQTKSSPITMPVKRNEEDGIIEPTRAGADVESLPWGAGGRSNDKSSQNRVLVKGGKVVNEDGMSDADVYIEDGIIKQVGPNLIVPGGSRVVDARGQYVVPGGIDGHTHMQLPFMGTRTVDDFYSGTKAAIAGGTTMIIDFVISPETSLLDGYDRWRSWADERVCCDYALHIGITKWVDNVTDKEMDILVKEKGVNSFKCFMAYKGTLMLTDGELLKVFDSCKRIGAIPMVHAESGEAIDYLSKKLLRLGVNGPEGHLQARPEEIEAEATHRAITLANLSGAPLYVVHVMSKSAADEIAKARSAGSVVFGEVLAAGLGSDGSHYFNRCWRHAAGHVLSPPLRPDKSTPEYLMNQLSSGQLQTTGSDHCVFSGQQKALGEKDFTNIPNGVNGVEERMMIVWEKGVKTGKLDPCQFVAVTSSNTAKIFNIYPRKGRIAVGSDADIVVWGRKPKTISAEDHHSAVDFNIFEGTTVEFSPIVVIAKGRVVLDEDGNLHVCQGSGRFVPTPPFPAHIYHRLHMRELNMGPIKVDRSAALEAKQNAGDGKEEKPVQKAFQAPTNLALEAPLLAIRLSDVSATPSSPGSVLTPSGFHKTHTRSGVRHQQDTTFRLTGEQVDDERSGRTGIKVAAPPGGRSSGLW